MSNVTGIINDGMKAFGLGGRLYADSPESPDEADPKPERAPTPVRPVRSAVPPKRRWADLWQDFGSTALELVGIAAVSFGAYQVYVPAGWITAGISLVVLGIAIGVDQ